MTKSHATRRVRRIFCAAALAILPSALAGQSTPPVAARSVDAVFEAYTAGTPGCAVGVATGGKPVFAKGYGMADLEHEVPITSESIFEAGSVSKQFTAAAVLLLARDGKLSLDDEVRKYVPELPEYPPPPDVVTPGYAETSPKPQAAKAGPWPVTIRQMLTHTSGLRDWGNVESIAGWPRTSRVYTHAHVLEIVSRQHALNFPPGTRWSYTNTGFNLAAIIVQRVSGMPFPEFTRTRLFQPLGMTHTSWRDDYTRIVKGRALAYRKAADGFHTNMPFENVYGNGGLLTTVGDLLKWNEHFDAPSAADAPLVAEQQKAGRFNDGRAHGYGLGLFLQTYKGLREVNHSGSTAGYSAFLTRFPDQRLSVAVLCNASNADATGYAHAVAELYLGQAGRPPMFAAGATLSGADLDRLAGLYRNRGTGVATTIVRDADGLRIDRWPALLAQSGSRFVTPEGEVTLAFDAHGGATATDQFGTVDHLERVAPAHYTDMELAALAGTYESDDAETVLRAAVENHALVLKRRPDVTITLTPTYADAFTASGGLGTVIFRRDATGRPTALSVVQDRVWDLRFQRKQ